MQTLKDLKAVTVSATQSAAVSLNAAADAYALLEAVRKGYATQLLQTAAFEYRKKQGCTDAEAFVQIGIRALYLHELASGESTFRNSKAILTKQQNESVLLPAI